MGATGSATLAEALARELPARHKFKYHHASTIPASCPALYSPPPSRTPEKTYCETHLLHVSVSPSGDFAKESIAVFAIEVYIYTTKRLTTVFVSKADSTGYTPLLNLPKGSASIAKGLSSGFLSWLIRERIRPDRPLVLSLFARAQEQYLFPGSAENSTKHVLDDRQLVKWWCRTLDPVVRAYPAKEHTSQTDDSASVWSQAYLIVPGQDKYETTAFYPPSVRADAANNKRWVNGDPLRLISSHPAAPPRCLVPHYPDDPKARFLMDLDVELQSVHPSQQVHHESPSKRGNGHWKSVKTLEQFWDMMAFRQECSSGRLTGFMWIAFMPLDTDRTEDQEPPSPSLKPHVLDSVKLPPPGGLDLASPKKLESHPKAVPAAAQDAAPGSERKRKKTRKLVKPKSGLAKRDQVQKRKKAKLRGPIIPRPPRVKRSFTGDSVSLKMPETTEFYHFPKTSRGSILLDQKAYNRVHETLCRLDYASRDIAKSSTFKWIQESAIVAGQAGRDWGIEIEGQKLQQASCSLSNGGGVNILAGAKRKTRDEETKAEASQAREETASSVNTLSAGMVRKKPKTQAVDAQAQEASSQDQPPAQDTVNNLGTMLVRKKAKT